MQHFLNLEKCTCGAYRYLAVREHKRSYEVYLIHHAHGQNSEDRRKYAKLASIPKHKLNIHDTRLNDFKIARSIQVSSEQIRALRSLVKDLEIGLAVTDYEPESTVVEEAEIIPA